MTSTFARTRLVLKNSTLSNVSRAHKIAGAGNTYRGLTAAQKVKNTFSTITMAEELMNRLIHAVDTLREETQHRNENANVGQGSRAAEQSTEDVMRRLYPSINSANASQTPASARPSATSAPVNINPDRRYVENVRNFQPSNNYGPKKGKKALSKKRKRPASATQEETKEKSVLRDVVLLSSPTIIDVPRGLKREQLFTQGCVISAFEIRDSHTEKNIRTRMNNAFEEKLRDVRVPKFTFVRAVGNKVIDPACESYNGNVKKYLNKQGPIYIRALSAIRSMEIWKPDMSDDDSSVPDEDDIKEENFGMVSDDDVLLVSAFDQEMKKSKPRTVTYSNSDEVQEVEQGEASSTESRTQAGNQECRASTKPQSLCGSPRPVEVINCPTCYCSTEIAEAEGLSCSRRTYGNLLMEFPHEDIITSADDQETMPIVENPKTDLNESLQALKTNVNEARSTIYVRRKVLWEDYVDASKHSKWFNPDNSLKVNFIGEPAVDGGGPKREFFCGIVYI